MDETAIAAFEETAGLVMAAEEWSPEYSTIPDQHAQLIKLMARMERMIMVYFRMLSGRIDDIVRWENYEHMVKAYDVNVFVDENGLDQSDTQFIKVIFDTVATIQALGAESAQVQTGRQVVMGLTSRDELIQQMTTDQIGALVGKRIDPTSGLLIDNPNAAYNIDETTRTRIANSIKTSINLGESRQEATKRLNDVIADPKRAAMIARTETVRAFAMGRHQYGLRSGATGHQWSDSNATDICADNTAQGIIPIDQDFVSGDPYEPAHINCKCLSRLVYADEYSVSDAFDDGTDNADTAE
jgi:anti-anti-sigma regulatory factor